MSLRSLMEQFSTREVVPVDVEEIVDAMVALGVKDEIYFWEVEIDSKHLRGALVHWEPWDYPTDPSGKNVKVCADVYYAKGQGRDWQRLVSCKELIHILDPEISRTDTAAKVNALVDKIVLPPELQDAAKDGLEAGTDRAMLYMALGLLFPFAARQLLLPLEQMEKRTTKEIALMVDLPERFVALVMHESWDEIHGLLMAWA